MDTSQLASLASSVRSLPVDSTVRRRRLHRLADLYAAAEAEAALKRAASPEGGETGLAADVLSAASAVWNPGASAASELPDDEAAHDALRRAVLSAEFKPILAGWIREMRVLASERPDSGSCTLGTALQLWLWTLDHSRDDGRTAEGQPARAVDDLIDGLCPVLAARSLVREVAGRVPGVAAVEGHRADLSHVYAAHAAAAMGALCAELVFGYRRHLIWDEEGCATCYRAGELDELEAFIPGYASGARAVAEVIEEDGSHALKAGPCVRFDGVETFTRLRGRLDGCLTGARLAKERAAATIGGR